MEQSWCGTRTYIGLDEHSSRTAQTRDRLSEQSSLSRVHELRRSTQMWDLA